MALHAATGVLLLRKRQSIYITVAETVLAQTGGARSAATWPQDEALRLWYRYWRRPSHIAIESGG